MQILVRRDDMTVLGVFADTDRVMLEKDRIVTPRYNIAGFNKDTAVLHRGVKVLPATNPVGGYYFNGDRFMKIPAVKGDAPEAVVEEVQVKEIPEGFTIAGN